jgi:hypothetical protein
MYPAQRLRVDLRSVLPSYIRAPGIGRSMKCFSSSDALRSRRGRHSIVQGVRDQESRSPLPQERRCVRLSALGQTRTSVNGGPMSGFTSKADPIAPSPYVS